MHKTTDIFYKHDEFGDHNIKSPLPFTSITPNNRDTHRDTNRDTNKGTSRTVTDNLHLRLHDIHTRILKKKYGVIQTGGKTTSHSTHYTDYTDYTNSMASKYFPDKSSDFSSSVYASHTEYNSTSDDIPYNIDTTEMAYMILKDELVSSTKHKRSF